MTRRLLVIPIPMAAALLLRGVLFLSGADNPVLYIRADAGTLIVLAGVLLSATAAAVVLGGWWLAERELEGRVEEAGRHIAAEERRRFLRRLDHELKNPLTAIRAGVANAADSPDPAAVRASLSSVESQVVRLSRLLADLRKLAELETQPLELAPVDIGELLEEALLLAEERPEATERNIVLTVPRAPWPLPAVLGDWDLLFLAVHNLLDNAIKYTLPGNTIEARAYEDGASVIVEVADTGPGIPEAELPHVWEELSRGYSARGVAGSGLGLALVRTITERHGGRVNLRSKAGHGTVFSLRLPVAAQGAASSSPQNQSSRTRTMRHPPMADRSGDR